MLHPETCTNDYVDINQPPTKAEDGQATRLAIQSLVDCVTKSLSLAFDRGWNGWNRPSLCPIANLLTKLDRATEEGDLVKMASYLVMLHGRGVTNINDAKKRVTEIVDVSNRIQELAEHVQRLIDIQPGMPDFAAPSIREAIQLLEMEITHLGIVRAELMDSQQ